MKTPAHATDDQIDKLLAGSAHAGVERQDAVLLCDRAVNLVLVGKALEQFGMTLAKTAAGTQRVEYAPITRDDALRLNRENARDMHFTPFDGYCYCGADIVEQTGIHAIAAGANVTGCRSCHRSYCD